LESRRRRHQIPASPFGRIRITQYKIPHLRSGDSALAELGVASFRHFKEKRVFFGKLHSRCRTACCDRVAVVRILKPPPSPPNCARRGAGGSIPPRLIIHLSLPSLAREYLETTAPFCQGSVSDYRVNVDLVRSNEQKQVKPWRILPILGTHSLSDELSRDCFARVP